MALVDHLDEQTNEYTPPEDLLYADWYEGPTSTRLNYDMWSVGVVILELILESSEIFQVTDYTHSKISSRITTPTLHISYLSKET
ncbi:hypothetical protein ACFX2A_045252 [Malus domestica]